MPHRVLITAGGSGIGKAIAEQFENKGSEVWVADLDAEALETCPATWQKTALDVRDETAMRALFDRVNSVWGGIDALCANAGVAGPTAKVEDIALEDWQDCVSVNLESAFLAAKFATPIMKKQKSGSITLTSSTAGLYG